jgi:uncharacterized protein YidB (DUF937 family)
MGLFDLVGEVAGGAQQAGNASVISSVIGLVTSHPGGLPGLIQAFEQQGLGGAVQSWIGSGPNQPITAEQIQSVVGADRINELAAKLGVSPEAATSAIAQHLPQVIDHLTPNGAVPASGANLMEMGEGLLKSFIK